MAAPAVTEFTGALYAELPEHFRSNDEPAAWPLLRYLAVTGDQAQEVVDQLALLQSGAMGDPVDAPAGWLDWMAQFVALNTTGLTIPEKRQAIDSASALLAGSLQSLKDTVEALLGGEKRYVIALHDGGDPWKIRIFAHTDDAGGSTWDTLALDWPSWNAWDAAGSWDNLSTVADFAAREAYDRVKPAWILLDVETLADGHIWLFLEESITSWTQWEAQWASWADFESAVFAWP